MGNSEKYLNMKQAADFLGVSEKTLRRYVAASVVPYTKPVRRYYFAKSHLVAFINNEL